MTRVQARYPLLLDERSARLSLDSFAARAGLHPEVIRRFVALGLVTAKPDQAGRLWFAPRELAVVARIRRLRESLPLNYAALGLVLDLLDRISELENTARRTSRWT
jgi:DNA-binding transcriptional MerR regulator